MTEQAVWYRMEDYLESRGYTDVCGEYVSTGSTVRVRVCELPLLKRTPKGVKVRDTVGRHRFIADNWHKRYACATKEEALTSFIARKTRQRGIHMRRAENAAKAIAVACAMMNSPAPENNLPWLKDAFI